LNIQCSIFLYAYLSTKEISKITFLVPTWTDWALKIVAGPVADCPVLKSAKHKGSAGKQAAFSSNKRFVQLDFELNIRTIF
jgi:hypothetical protein